MADKLILKKRDKSIGFALVNVPIPAKEKIDRVAEETGYTRGDVVAAMVDFGFERLEIVEADK